jgi:hypothetical protein
MTMRRKQVAGSKYMPGLDKALDNNQDSLVDELITPHSTRLNEMLGCQHRITAKYPAHQVDAQPTQARGRIVWNEAYAFQPHGPSYLDPIPDPGRGGGY